MKKIKGTFLLFAMMLTLLAIPASARDIGSIYNFTVYYETTDVGEKYTSYCYKEYTNRSAVINLQETTANGKYITAIMRNSDGAPRGSTYLQVGTRKVFASTGQAGYKYRLGLRKTYNTDGGLTATLYGSWCPDSY